MRRTWQHLYRGGGPRRPRPAAVVALGLAALFSVVPPARSAARDDSAAVEFFEKKVRPLLVANCYTCHSADTNSQRRPARRRSQRPAHRRQSRPAVIPGKPDESLLIKAVSSHGQA